MKKAQAVVIVGVLVFGMALISLAVFLVISQDRLLEGALHSIFSAGIAFVFAALAAVTASFFMERSREDGGEELMDRLVEAFGEGIEQALRRVDRRLEKDEHVA